MRTTTFLIILILSQFSSRSQIIDDFSRPGQLLSSPWQGDVNQFKINTSQQLQLNAQSAGQSTLFALYRNHDKMLFKFYVKLSFNTSSNNFARVYLMADSLSILFSSEALYLEFGEQADSVRLVYKDWKGPIALHTFKTINTSSTLNEFQIHAQHESSGIISITVMNSNGDSIESCTIKHTIQFRENSFFGFHCKYTISNASKFYLDNLFIGHPDSLPKPVYTEPVKPGDILISEVLFNPRDNGSDFIELYNASDYPLNMKGLQLSNRYEDGTLKDIYAIIENDFILPSKSLLLISSNIADIKDKYNVFDSIIAIETSLPPFNNDEGTVVLLKDSTEIIDEMIYSETMHFALLTDVEGISLERISFEMKSMDRATWHSASTTSLGATPGMYNSQHMLSTDTINESELFINPPVFSPDNDGYQDVVEINYKLDAGATAGSLYIINRQGILVKTLCNNQLFDHEGVFIWDGLDDARKILRPDIYIAVIDIYDLNGKRDIKKGIIVLANKTSNR